MYGRMGVENLEMAWGGVGSEVLRVRRRWGMRDTLGVDLISM